MAYILHHSTTFSAHGTGYHKMDEGGHSPPGHGHSHMLGGHDNTSVRAAFIHVVGDLLQSIGVMVAAIIIYFWVSFRVTVCNQITLCLPSSLVIWLPHRYLKISVFLLLTFSLCVMFLLKPPQRFFWFSLHSSQNIKWQTRSARSCSRSSSCAPPSPSSGMCSGFWWKVLHRQIRPDKEAELVYLELLTFEFTRRQIEMNIYHLKSPQASADGRSDCTLANHS